MDKPTVTIVCDCCKKPAAELNENGTLGQIIRSRRSRFRSVIFGVDLLDLGAQPPQDGPYMLRSSTGDHEPERYTLICNWGKHRRNVPVKAATAVAAYRAAVSAGKRKITMLELQTTHQVSRSG